MGSCVDENGNMNFGTVEAYVKEATNAGISIYGHTLAWHAQQPTAWLKTLVANKVAPVDPKCR
jgi:Beta-1,4-xylanase